jgi:hypothetical protein
MGICGYCKKEAGHKCANCTEKLKKGNGKGNGDGEKFNNCGKYGHNEEGCEKKHPEKAPQWHQHLKKKNEASGSSVDIALVSVDDCNVDQDFARLLSISAVQTSK